MRVTIVHDYLNCRGGAERVVLAMMRAFPSATLVTGMYSPDQTFPEFSQYDVRTTFLQHLPAARRDPRFALPFLARAFSSYPLPPTDVVICSTSGWAHGIRSSVPKIVYCHNPPRWLYQTSEYAAEQSLPVRLGLELLRNRLTAWDRSSASSAATYLANSSTVRSRIMRAYSLDAIVLPPPVSIDVSGPREPVPGLSPGFLLSVARPRGYKNADRLVAAMAHLPGERLVMVGPSPACAPPAVTCFSNLPDAQLRWLYANCSALLAVGYEDFGLTPIEANAFGKPALCLQAGGYLDSLVPGVSGFFVDSVSPVSIAEGVNRLRAAHLDPAAIARHAASYDETQFGDRLRSVVARTLSPTRLAVVPPVVPPGATGVAGVAGVPLPRADDEMLTSA